MDIASLLLNSGFNESFIKLNRLKDNKFKEWIFVPGMLFSSMEKWWGTGRRDRPHEGLDLCFYADHKHNIFRLSEKIKIPALFDGIIAGIIDDFLGKSIIIKHNISSGAGTVFCSILGHVIPHKIISVDSIVKQGDVIASVAASGGSKTKISPHLHLSLGHIIEDFPLQKLDWNTISDPGVFSLLDPIRLIKEKYRILDYEEIKKLIDI